MRSEIGNRERKPNHVPAVLLIVVLALVLAAVIVLAVQAKEKDADTWPEAVSEVTEDSDGGTEKWQEGVVSYNGSHYLYNTSIKTYLFMGIDKTGKVTEAEKGNEGGRSDAMFLLVENPKKEELSIIAINRNSMVDVEVYDENGEYLSTGRLQICLQHEYGDGMRLSCNRSVNAVSRLFYNLPINGYLSLNMEGISLLNDLVGGVTVTPEHDLNSESFGVSLKAGETVTLTGQEAYAYLRYRDTSEFNSATDRLERQMDYLLQLFSKLKQTGTDGMVDAYEQIEDYLVTNMDFAKLAEEALAYRFDESRMYSVPGEMVKGNIYEEYNVDDEALYKMILDIFYEPEE